MCWWHFAECRSNCPCFEIVVTIYRLFRYRPATSDTLLVDEIRGRRGIAAALFPEHLCATSSPFISARGFATSWMSAFSSPTREPTKRQRKASPPVTGSGSAGEAESPKKVGCNWWLRVGVGSPACIRGALHTVRATYESTGHDVRRYKRKPAER